MIIRPLELIEPFLADVRPARPDLCRDVLQVALSRRFPTDPTKAIEFWSFFTQATNEVFIEVYTSGSGVGHTFKLLERWFRWLGRTARLPSEDVALWLFELERSRRSHLGMKPRYMRLPDGDELSGVEAGVVFTILRGPPGLERFLDNVVERDRDVAELAAKTVVVWLAEHRGAPVVFDDFDPNAYLVSLLEMNARASHAEAQLMLHAASYLEGRVSDEIVRKTRELALSLAFAA